MYRIPVLLFTAVTWAQPFAFAFVSWTVELGLLTAPPSQRSMGMRFSRSSQLIIATCTHQTLLSIQNMLKETCLGAAREENVLKTKRRFLKIGIWTPKADAQ